jgi:UV DNA damage endonuclease
MRIGYACINTVLKDSASRTCRKRNATQALLTELIGKNLDALERIIDYNIAQRIRLFRISSDLIPFGSDDVNVIDWVTVFRDRFTQIGAKIRQSGMRVSMHPGQYTVLNSPEASIVRSAVEDLKYHAKVLDALGTDSSHKIVLHIGGVYGNRPLAMERFVHNWRVLPASIQHRLVIENDDRLFHIHDVLSIGLAAGIPVVYDNLHNRANPSAPEITDREWIERCTETWRPVDGHPKIHYSQQDPGKRIGAHSERIAIDEFLDFVDHLGPDAPDIMLEVKDKNISAVKCMLCTSPDTRTRDLESEWSLYKYKILEQSPTAYLAIRELLKDKKGCPARAFYRLTEGALRTETSPENVLTAAQHVWGYFKKKATEKERRQFFDALDGYWTGKKKADTFRRILYQLAVKYEETYLLKSYYFFL